MFHNVSFNVVLFPGIGSSQSATRLEYAMKSLSALLTLRYRSLLPIEDTKQEIARVGKKAVKKVGLGRRGGGGGLSGKATFFSC